MRLQGWSLGFTDAQLQPNWGLQKMKQSPLFPKQSVTSNISAPGVLKQLSDYSRHRKNHLNHWQNYTFTLKSQVYT